MVCGINLNHVPFTGGAAMVTALLGKHVDCVQIAFSTIMAHVMPGGGLRALAIFAPERLRELPDVPTAMERGYNLDRASWFYFAVAKGTPQSVLDILRKTFKQTVDDPQVKEALFRIGFTPLNLDPEETEKKIQKEFDAAREVFEKVGLTQ